MESIDFYNIVSTEDLSPDPITWNALTTLIMYDTTKEFPELCPEEKPTQLPTLRQLMQMIEHGIGVTSDSHQLPRFPSTYNQFQDQITEKIYTELESGRIVPSRYCNPIGMFMEVKTDKLHK